MYKKELKTIYGTFKLQAAQPFLKQSHTTEWVLQLAYLQAINAETLGYQYLSLPLLFDNWKKKTCQS